jgi:rubrerythrin
MEKDGIEFYQKLAGKIEEPSGKKMVLSFADDERRHLKILNSIFSAITSIDAEKYIEENPLGEKVKTIFQDAEKNIDVKAYASELSALKIAMDMEEKSYKFYEEAMSAETDPNLKKLWARLVEEEKRHYDIFFNTYDFLANPEDWILREERGLLDGG